MYYPRSITKRLYQLLETFPVVVITGARQVGKSTLLLNTIGKKADVVVFDPVVDVENARQAPELFLNNRPPPLVLDEIQYAPELVASIKRRIDKDRSPGQYVLTGSQQWGVIKSMAESLAGRAVFIDLDAFSLAEISGAGLDGSWLESWLDDPEAFLAGKPGKVDLKTTLYEQLWRGGLPEAQFLPLEMIPDFHAAYQRTYIERDVRLLADVSDWQLFGRFVRLAAALTAQEINHSQMGRELGLNPQTSKRWLDILQSTFQWFEVPAYAGNVIKRISGKPKGFIIDTGVACAAQAISTPKAIGGHPLFGALFETAVASEIRKQMSLLSPKPNLYHWRTHGGAEVDFILERDAVFYPIEVKASTQPQRKDTSGISAFRKTYPSLKIQKGLIIAPVDHVRPLSETDVLMPWDVSCR